ncbi:MAG: hypothetical protein K1X95_02705 [Acidimicrobiia bacterium]|nr:hypothetical protein [Acidimicrobiia bacterium]
MQSRRLFLKGVAAGAASAAGMSAVGGGLLAASPAAQAADDPACAPQIAPTPTASPRAGWNVYDSEAIDPVHLSALQQLRPTILRWFVSWDRHHILGADEADGIPAPPDWLNGPYRAFLDLCQASTANPRGTTLVVQFTCKEPGWTGDGWPTGRPGTTWARKDRWLGSMYPDRYGIAPTYGAFVRSVKAAMDELGIDAHYGAWNEPDLRTSVGVRYATQNFVEPWAVNPFDLARGAPYHNWSGGAGPLWQELHAQLPGSSMTTSGIIFPEWITRTAELAGVGVIDIHLYDASSDPQQYVTRCEEQVQAWDDAAPGLARRKVLLGEAATDFALAHTVSSAAWLWQRHEALSQANENSASPLYGRYLGMCSHSGKSTADAPAPWQLAPTDPAAGWWQYNPAYASFT